MSPDLTFPRTDHDLLIEVSTNVRNLNDTLTAYTAASSKSTHDHELRIRDLEAAKQQNVGTQRTMKTILSVLSVASVILGAVLTWVALGK